MNLSRRSPVALCSIFAFAFPSTDDPAAGGATPKAPSIDAQLTAATARIGEMEAAAAAWDGEKTTLAGERDTALARVTTLEGQLSAATTAQTQLNTRVSELTSSLATATTQVTNLTAERDEARRLAANPSAQARVILAQAGAPAVATRPDGNRNPAAAATQAADAGGKTPLQRAMAKAAAKASAAKG